MRPAHDTICPTLVECLVNKITIDAVTRFCHNTRMSKKVTLNLTENEKTDLRMRSRSHSVPVRESRRAKIILLRDKGLTKEATAKELSISGMTVQKWTARFQRFRLAGLADQPRPGRPEKISADLRERIITEATQPPRGRARHSTRSMARALGVSPFTVHVLWRKNGIKPHLTRTFKISRDPDFKAKFWDVVGLYLDPPAKAIVFCCDEKTQCQALERTQKGLPLDKGHVRTQTHDYARHGTTTLFAALDYATGKVLHDKHQTHTHREWVSFLELTHASVPDGLSIEIIADNYATHKHDVVREWLKAHPRVHMHYTPTSSSWMNLVERFFGEITRDCIRDGSFSSVAELEKAIDLYLERHNENPSRIVWHADGEGVLRKINKTRAILKMEPFDTTPPGK